MSEIYQLHAEPDILYQIFSFFIDDIIELENIERVCKHWSLVVGRIWKRKFDGPVQWTMEDLLPHYIKHYRYDPKDLWAKHQPYWFLRNLNLTTDSCRDFCEVLNPHYSNTNENPWNCYIVHLGSLLSRNNSIVNGTRINCRYPETRYQDKLHIRNAYASYQKTLHIRNMYNELDYCFVCQDCLYCLDNLITDNAFSRIGQIFYQACINGRINIAKDLLYKNEDVLKQLSERNLCNAYCLRCKKSVMHICFINAIEHSKGVFYDHIMASYDWQDNFRNNVFDIIRILYDKVKEVTKDEYFLQRMSNREGLLLNAARYGKNEVIDLLCELGCRVNDTVHYITTARCERDRCCIYLNGVNFYDECGEEDALHVYFCDECGNKDAWRDSQGCYWQAMEDCRYGHRYTTNITTPILEAAIVGCTSTVRRLHQHGANLNFQDSLGNTAVTYAARWGHIDTVKMLYELGASDAVIFNWFNSTASVTKTVRFDATYLDDICDIYDIYDMYDDYLDIKNDVFNGCLNDDYLYGYEYD